MANGQGSREVGSDSRDNGLSRSCRIQREQFAELGLGRTTALIKSGRRTHWLYLVVVKRAAMPLHRSDSNAADSRKHHTPGLFLSPACVVVSAGVRKPALDA